MTPKEKAEDLINKMLGLEIEDITKFDYIDHEAAKHFALIAVDEIIKANPYEVSKTDMDSTIDYWQEVKQEIEKL